MPNASPLQPPIPQKPGQTIGWENLTGSSIGLALSNLIIQQPHPILIITSDSLTATRLEYELNFFHQGHPIIHFPDWETLPYDLFSPHHDIISERLAALAKIPHMQRGAIITPISTLMHRLAPRHYLAGNTFIFKQGDKYNLDTARSSLVQAGYQLVDQVRQHGEFAIRGSIIDIFPMGSNDPFRIDLFDDEIDSIRIFSPENQRSSEKIEQIALLPAKEFPVTDESIEYFRKRFRELFTGNPIDCNIYQDVSEGICPPGIEYYLPFFFNETTTFFDYLPANTLVVQHDEIPLKAEEFWREVTSRYEQRRYDRLRPLLAPEEVFIPVAEILRLPKNYKRIKILGKSIGMNEADFHFPVQAMVDVSIESKATRPLHALADFLANYTGRMLICAETNGRREVLAQLFQGINFYPQSVKSWEEFLSSDIKYGLTVAPLDAGFMLADPNITLIAESQLFGHRVLQRRRRKTTEQNTANLIKDLAELQIGSPIVHIDHGVGRYLGLQTININDQTNEFLALEYLDNAKLYVPVNSLHLISRYSGSDPEHAPIHRLGTENWSRAKRKACDQVRDVAAELLEIYSKRAARPGVSCAPPDEQYAAFAASFPFEETPDQMQAIENVLADMQSEKPMDRLVCGDVGFGKTEVAMRAAFMAVQNNKQVVLLVPTTLLAQQHYQNFLDRFADWPIQIALLSRFKTSKEQQKTIELLSTGNVDIVIGTHKLLQEHITYKNLGLLIIDEEHRFGVRQKERIKALRESVDILTLTATPIPRTLNMAFAGIRDLSLIATPPAKRLAIKTFVQEMQPAILQEAITREILRGGQVYFLHNDVATIERTARELEKLIPEARVCVAHGQMRERELEQIMTDFYHRRFNLLVCTTIIESGIDVPSANTIIINRADKFGLAQLHQLRGRVGRSHHQAYAYLLIPSLKLISSDAKKRLDAISSLEDLGIGFTLATHDLEIRGAGELLGEGQSGNMHAVGFSLYMDLLAQAVDALKAGKPITNETHVRRGAEIDLQITALIPDSYLGDVNLRLQFYKHIASTATQAELDEIQVEMIDRFGLMPGALKNLFALHSLRQHAELLGISKIEGNSKGGKIEFGDKPNIDPMNIIRLIQRKSSLYKMEGPTKLKFMLPEHEMVARVGLVETILSEIG